VEGYATSVFTDEAIDWISAQEQPWFLWLAYTAPHPPYHLPPSDLHTQQELTGSEEDIASNSLPYYLAMMEAMDSELGRLLASLSNTERDNTIVIFVGDNGTPEEAIQRPYENFQTKSTIFEGGIHVPLIVAGAGVTRHGQREASLINTTDLFATIADLAGAGITKTGDSMSFRHLLTDTAGPKRSFLYAEFNDQFRKWRNAWAIRDSRYKLIQSSRARLFDLFKDPFERQDLLETDPSDEVLAIADRLTKAGAIIRQE
jgi:arylsulfatase A-like enzyme